MTTIERAGTMTGAGAGPSEGSSVRPLNVMGALFSGTTTVAAGLFTTLLVLFYLLVSGETFMRRFVEILPSFAEKRQAVELTLDIERNAFSRGLPQWGAQLANELERLIALHDASTIAAVIVEPVSGSAGVVLPPVGYLKRLREICDKHDILLIFDEVITGFGRVGKPFAAQAFDVTPDLMTTAKGLTNGAIPMGAVFSQRKIYDAFMQGPENAIELFHGYTYSAHPVACAAALATLDIYLKEGLLTRAASLSAHWETAVHSLRGLPHVVDLRNYGLIGAVEMEPRQGKPGARGFDVFLRCFERGVMVRQTGDTIAMAPPLIIEPAQIEHLVETLGQVIRETA